MSIPTGGGSSSRFGLHGLAIDTSNNNPITAQELRLSKAVLLIAKGTEGIGFDDRVFASQRAAAASAETAFGGYLFMRQNQDPAKQLGEFLRFTKLRKDEFAAIDAETTDGVSLVDIALNVDMAAQELYRKGHPPLVYMPISLWRDCVALQPGLKRWWVWEPQYPGNFTRWQPRISKLRIRIGHGANLGMWQWTNKYRVGNHFFDASRLFVPLDRLRYPAVLKGA